MAAASSSSFDADSSVVELRRVADVEDTATSARFFHEDDGAGGAISSFSWPEAEKTTSKLTSQRELQDLCDKVPAGYTPTGLYGWGACRPPPEGSICVYADALEAGMRVPLHDFYVAVLLHYGLAPSQLPPNAWRYMAAFVLLCKDVGVDPMLSVFRFFFSICNHRGWYHFRHYAVLLPDDPGAGHRRLFTGRLPRCTDWKSRFLLLQSPSTAPWPCPVKWGKPCRDAVRTPPKARDTTTAIKKLLDRAGSSGIDLMSFLSRHSLPVGPQATLTPEQRAVKVEEAAAAAAAGPRSEPTPTRKRKSLEIVTRGPDVPASCGLQSQAQQRNAGMSMPPGCSLVGQSFSSALGNDGSAMHGFVLSMKGASEFAEKVVAELQKKEKELQESKGEVTQLRAELAKLQREHEAKVAQLSKQLEEEHAAKVAKLTKQQAEEHAAKVAKLNREHAANIACLKPIVQKEVLDATKDMMLALSPKLVALFLKLLHRDLDKTAA